MKDAGLRQYYRYTVYDNKTVFPIAVNQTSRECAKQMGIKMSTWYNCFDRCKKGLNNRWKILKHDKVDQLCVNEYRGVENLPPMIRINQLADFLSTTDKCIVKLCERIGCPIVRAGRQKIKMIPRENFFQKMKQESNR